MHDYVSHEHKSIILGLAPNTTNNHTPTTPPTHHTHTHTHAHTHTPTTQNILRGVQICDSLVRKIFSAKITHTGHIFRKIIFGSRLVTYLEK